MATKNKPTTKIDLDKYFRKDSAARKVAEAYLTGEPIARQQIAGELNIAVTSVNRVIDALEEAGAKFVRDVDGRQAIFRLVSIGNPKSKKPYPPVGATAKVVGLEMVGGKMTVTFAADDAKYRGTLANLTQPSMSTGEVTGVNKHGDSGAVQVTLSVGSKTVHVHNVHNVAD